MFQNLLELFGLAVKKLFKVPKTNLKSAGNRSFHFQAAKIWNSLPTNVRSSPSLSSFKKKLKTHLSKERFSLGLWNTFSAQFDYWVDVEEVVLIWLLMSCTV